MVTAALLAAAVVLGVPGPVVVLLGVGSAGPAPALIATGALLAWAVAHRERGERPAHEEAVWLGAVAGELRAGASLRMALVAASDGVPGLDTAELVRLASAGADYERLGDAVQRSLPGRTPIAPMLRLAGQSGGRAAAVVDRLAMRAWEDVAITRERRTLTAQARLSAWVVGGLPVLVTVVLATTGRLGALVDSSTAGGLIVTTGLLLQLGGLAGVAVLLRRVPA